MLCASPLERLQRQQKVKGSASDCCHWNKRSFWESAHRFLAWWQQGKLKLPLTLFLALGSLSETGSWRLNRFLRAQNTKTHWIIYKTQHCGISTQGVTGLPWRILCYLATSKSKNIFVELTYRELFFCWPSENTSYLAIILIPWTNIFGLIMSGESQNILSAYLLQVSDWIIATTSSTWKATRFFFQSHLCFRVGLKVRSHM